MLPPNFRSRLQVTQQCRPEDIERVRETYARLGIPAECATYLEDLPQRLAWTHLVIAPSGASTVAELTTAGRPALLIPFAVATDDPKTRTARALVATGVWLDIPPRRFALASVDKPLRTTDCEEGRG